MADIRRAVFGDSLRLSGAGLVCERGGRLVFSGVHVGAASREAVAVRGRNGAGKSSLLRMIAGLLRVAGGTLTFEGGDEDASIAEQAHYLGHQDALKPALSVLENLSFWIAWLGGEGEAHEALATVGLDTLADLPAGYLSAGQRRRLSLARLVAIRRPLWLLDEPTSALDAQAQATLAAIMRTHLAAGGIIVAATHAPLGIETTHDLQLGPAT